MGVRGGAVAPVGHPRGGTFALVIALFLSAFNFLYVVALPIRPIGLFCFWAVPFAFSLS